jgi:protein-disulfide isomerase
MRNMLRRTAATGLVAGGAVLAAVMGGRAAFAQAADALKVLERDHVLGKADAPITIVEYASLTCPHCAQFHGQILPELKKKWIDSGRARLVYRDFPLDRMALQAAQIAECSGKDRYFGVLELLFQQQEKWASSRDGIAEIGRILRIAGIGDAEIRQCLANEAIANDAVLADYQSGEKAGVTGTPTLFINGQKLGAPRSFADVDAFLEKLGK